MPSNQIPEDVRAELKRKLAYELCTQWPPCADHEEAAGAAIADSNPADHGFEFNEPEAD